MKELEIFFIEDKRRPDQRDSGLAREPDGEPRVLSCEIADRLEGLVICGAMANDSGRDDLGAAKRRMNDVDETDVLVRIPRADFRPQQWLGFEECDLFGSIHASIFAGPRSVSSFLTCNTSVDDDPGATDALCGIDDPARVQALADRGYHLQPWLDSPRISAPPRAVLERLVV